MSELKKSGAGKIIFETTLVDGVENLRRKLTCPFLLNILKMFLRMRYRESL